jgi:aspartate carbamoyltransferase catalytic subunit
MKHIIESQQFDRKTIETLFQTADTLQNRKTLPMKGKILASLFYEPSTRTRLSFESAMIRLGGNVITTENAREFSSTAKGETLEDTIRVVNHYADVIVLRHYKTGASKRAAAVSRVPVINAGDGTGQHPTQALLDLYTIQKELGRIDGIKIAFVGDLKNGRTVRSLAYLLTRYKDVQINLVSPSELRLGQDIKDSLKQHHIQYQEMERWDSVIKKIDVLYQTRIQKERFKSTKEYSKFKGIYVLTLLDTKKMKPGSIVMHSLPRVDEITPEVDQSPKAVYFKQAHYGVIVRMALLRLLLE